MILSFYNLVNQVVFVFFFSSRRRHTRWTGDWSSDVCFSDLSLKHFAQHLLHFGIGSAAVGFGVLFLIPQTDSDRLRSAWDHEGDLVLETFLFSQERNDFLLDAVGKRLGGIGLETHGHLSCKHV